MYEFLRMREITWFVKGTLNVLLQSFSPTSIYLTGLQKLSIYPHIPAFTAIFSNICTAHAQKRLFMNFRCKYRHHCSIRRPRFLVRVQNFGDLATFSVDFWILYPTSGLFDWPRKYTIRVDPRSLKLIWLSTAELQRFYLLTRHVTWWPWPLTFWPWAVVIHGGSRDQPCHQVWRPYDYSFMPTPMLERVITVPIDYH